MVCVQLFQPTAHHFGGLIIPGNPQHLAFGGAGVHKQVHNLIDGVLIIRAKPEQQFDLQCLIKIIFELFSVRFIREERIVPLCFILISLIRLRFWLHLNCIFSSTRIAVCAILYLCFWRQSRRKVLDIDQAGSAQPSPFALNKIGLFQFPEQLDRLVFGAAERFLHFPDSVDDIHAPLLIQPVVLCGKAHTVKQDAIQCSGVRGKLPETAVLKECFRNTEVGKQFARLPIEVVVTHGINGSSTHGLRHLSYT